MASLDGFMGQSVEVPDDSVGCGSESCDRHNIMWLESIGLNHAQAIGIQAVWNFIMYRQYDSVSTALGGLEFFDNISDDPDNGPAYIAWFDSHRPLVDYCIGLSADLEPYWQQAWHPHYTVADPQEVCILIESTDLGATWQFLGQPVLYQSRNAAVESSERPEGMDPYPWLKNQKQIACFQITDRPYDSPTGK
jgi:hypothetical protein